MGLIKVLEDNSNVHIDNNHVADYDERSEIGYCQERVSAVSVHLPTGRSRIAIRWLHHQRF